MSKTHHCKRKLKHTSNTIVRGHVTPKHYNDDGGALVSWYLSKGVVHKENNDLTAGND